MGNQINAKKIEEEIRLYKLEKIQYVEDKIQEYNDVYHLIKENGLIKFTKNSTSNILRFILFLVTISLLIIGLFFVFPNQIISLIESNNDVINSTEKEDLKMILPFLGYILIGLSLILGFVSLLLKKNSVKRSVIYELSYLLDEVIGDMTKNLEDDKVKYAYFVDSIVDIGSKVYDKKDK